MPKTIIQRPEKYSMQCDEPALRTPPCRPFSLVVLVSWTDVVHPRFLLFILWFWPQNCLLFVLLMSQYPLLDRSQGPKLTKDGAYLTTRTGLASHDQEILKCRDFSVIPFLNNWRCPGRKFSFPPVWNF